MDVCYRCPSRERDASEIAVDRISQYTIIVHFIVLSVLHYVHACVRAFVCVLVRAFACVRVCVCVCVWLSSPCRGIKQGIVSILVRHISYTYLSQVKAIISTASS